MVEWSEEQLAIRDAVRRFVEEEVKPNVDALEYGDTPPYEVIRKLYATFGLDGLARDSFKRQLDSTGSHIRSVVSSISHRVRMARFKTEVNAIRGSSPARCSSRPARIASCRPSSLRSTSCQPVNRFSTFQVLWP